MESSAQTQQGKQALNLLWQHFSSLEDPRVERGKLHSLHNVLTMALCAVIGGADEWETVYEFALTHVTWFASLLHMPNGVPSKDTFRRVFCALEPRAFEECFRRWVKTLARDLNAQVVAVDGKSVRGALGTGLEDTVLHLVHVWASEQKLLLARMAVEGAPGEVNAIPELLKLLELKGAVVTVDANGCTAKVAQAIVEAGADYVLALKGNRGPLHEHVQEVFAQVRTAEEKKLQGDSASRSADDEQVQAQVHADEQQAQQMSHSRSEDAGHGRHEVRSAWALELKLEQAPASASTWVKLNSAVMLLRERTEGGKTTREWHYFICSMPPQAAQLARVIRSHWGVENGLHWSLDVSMNEDSRPIRDHNGAQNFALLSRMALTLLRREKTCKKGVPTKRKKAGWDSGYLVRVLKSAASDI
jgi:predicted transposase YbfD/YdcC